MAHWAACKCSSQINDPFPHGQPLPSHRYGLNISSHLAQTRRARQGKARRISCQRSLLLVSFSQRCNVLCNYQLVSYFEIVKGGRQAGRQEDPFTWKLYRSALVVEGLFLVSTTCESPTVPYYYFSVRYVPPLLMIYVRPRRLMQFDVFSRLLSSSYPLWPISTASCGYVWFYGWIRDKSWIPPSVRSYSFPHRHTHPPLEVVGGNNAFFQQFSIIGIYILGSPPFGTDVMTIPPRPPPPRE